jgi:2-polyprenyl-3-methyl-5-hydroxy-6-metoxy-1,4-benzoquinol methylase
MTPLCRGCGAEVHHTFVNLGVSPLANSYVKPSELNQVERFYPLHAMVCAHCYLVQLEAQATPEEIFTDYAYFSSYSDSWLEHAKTYVNAVSQRFDLSARSQVVELASNDGYLLQYFVKKGIPVLGIEPAANVAEVAVQRGIPTLMRFFGARMAKELVAQGIKADLIIGNNVLAHVPDFRGFVEGLCILLRAGGVITLEFPHLMRLAEENQFDTIYHEHFSYFSLLTIQRLFKAKSLKVFDVEELPTHGGSLRVFAAHENDASKPVGPRVDDLLQREKAAGFADLERYLCFGEKVKATKRKLLQFLIEAKSAKKNIVGYGAPAKGNTLLNYCGIGTDFLDYTVDRSPHKQGHFLPGSHVPIYAPERIQETKPDYVLILPWNLKDEIVSQMGHIRQWGGQFVVPIPEVTVV